MANGKSALEIAFMVAKLVVEIGFPAVQQFLKDVEIEGHELTPEYIRREIKTRFDKDPDLLFR